MDYSVISAEELFFVCSQTRDAPPWTEFVRRFHPLIARVVVRVARQWGENAPHVFDDLIQDTYLKLYAERTNLSQKFKPTHPEAVYAYIKVFTANLVHDHFKASRSQKRSSGTDISIDSPLFEHRAEGSATSSTVSLDRSVLLRQIESCLQTIAPGVEGQRDRRIFWLYYRVGLHASEIAALPMSGLTIKGVESTLLRLSRQLRELLVNRDRTISLSRIIEKGNQSAESL
jgi:RNA polymerase sigma-70 factor (ECF subfamily)